MPSEIDQRNNESLSVTLKDVDILGRSVGQMYTCDSSWVDDDDKWCLICNKNIRLKNRSLSHKTILIVA